MFVANDFYAAPVERPMNERDFEKTMLLMLLAGVIIAIANFIVMATVVYKPNIVGYQNAMLSSAIVMAGVVVVLWAAAVILRRKVTPEEVPQPIPPPPEDESSKSSAEA